MRAVPPRLDSTFHYMRSYIVCGHGWKMEDCDKRLSLPLIFYLKQTFQNSDFAVICFFFFSFVTVVPRKQISQMCLRVCIKNTVAI